MQVRHPQSNFISWATTCHILSFICKFFSVEECKDVKYYVILKIFGVDYAIKIMTLHEYQT
jgi:hypothetical protein